MKNKCKWTNITNVLADLIDEIQRHTMEKEDLGPFPLQWKALEALNWLLSLQRKDGNVGERTPSLFTQVRGE